MFPGCPADILYPIYISDALDPCTYWLCIGAKAYAYPCGDKTNNGVNQFWSGTADPCTLPNMKCKSILQLQKQHNLVKPLGLRFRNPLKPPANIPRIKFQKSVPFGNFGQRMGQIPPVNPTQSTIQSRTFRQQNGQVPQISTNQAVALPSIGPQRELVPPVPIGASPAFPAVPAQSGIAPQFAYPRGSPSVPNGRQPINSAISPPQIGKVQPQYSASQGPPRGPQSQTTSVGGNRFADRKSFRLSREKPDRQYSITKAPTISKDYDGPNTQDYSTNPNYGTEYSYGENYNGETNYGAEYADGQNYNYNTYTDDTKDTPNPNAENEVSNTGTDDGDGDIDFKGMTKADWDVFLRRQRQVGNKRAVDILIGKTTPLPGKFEYLKFCEHEL